MVPHSENTGLPNIVVGLFTVVMSCIAETGWNLGYRRYVYATFGCVSVVLFGRWNCTHNQAEQKDNADSGGGGDTTTATSGAATIITAAAAAAAATTTTTTTTTRTTTAAATTTTTALMQPLAVDWDQSTNSLTN